YLSRITPSWRYNDPRCGPLTGFEWDTLRPMVCRSLSLTSDPQPILTALSMELDQTYLAIASSLPENKSVRFEMRAGKEELILSPLDQLDET
ncbi:MAG: hypothetical protein K7J15_02345, partial [Candidatus Regiella insecticola]|nr:hypothetical protein [Candidatus Regiella insecticola]